MVGGELISPGDIVCGDDDGVVVVREKDIAKLVKACQERDDHENHMMELHRQGKMDIEDRYDMMRSKGCVWAD